MPRFNLLYTFRWIFPILSFVLFIPEMIMPTSVCAQGMVYEEPDVITVSSILPQEMQSGASYNLRAIVGIQGMHYSFDLWSRYGWYHPQSLDMLKIRLAEIRALDTLTEMQQDPIFREGLGDQFMGTADATVNSAKSPFKTAADIPLGLAKYGQPSQTYVEETQKRPDDRLLRLHEEAKRELAASLGGDPYTDNVPLQIALSDVAANKNRGALAGRFDIGVIPAVGSAVGAAHFDKSLQDMLVTHTESELQKDTRKKLSNIGVPKAEVDKFMRNPGYTPSRRAAIADALLGLSGVDGIQKYMRAIEDAPRPEVALFYQQRIQLAEKYHRSVRQISKLVLVGTTPVFFDRKGTLVVTVPIDLAYWNQDLANRISQVRKSLGKATGDIYITGTASDLVKQKMADQGLTLHEEWGTD